MFHALLCQCLPQTITFYRAAGFLGIDHADPQRRTDLITRLYQKRGGDQVVLVPSPFRCAA
eukprot:5620905-Pyramimonas_sp.AAC.1